MSTLEAGGKGGGPSSEDMIQCSPSLFLTPLVSICFPKPITSIVARYVAKYISPPQLIFRSLVETLPPLLLVLTNPRAWHEMGAEGKLRKHLKLGE